MPVVTVSRQFGSLGDEIASELASRLGLRLVDQDIINEVANRLGVTPETVRALDEREQRLAVELVHALRRLYPVTLGGPKAPISHADLDDSRYVNVVCETVLETARAGNAIIVGRGAAFILRDDSSTLHVMITAPLDVRIERVMSAEQLSRTKAAQRVRQVDGERSRYIRHFFHANWLDIGYYDLVLNCGHFDAAQCVSLIATALE